MIERDSYRDDVELHVGRRGPGQRFPDRSLIEIPDIAAGFVLRLPLQSGHLGVSFSLSPSLLSLSLPPYSLNRVTINKCTNVNRVRITYLHPCSTVIHKGIWMNEWMNEWVNEWMDECINEWMQWDGCRNEWMDGWIFECMKVLKVVWTKCTEQLVICILNCKILYLYISSHVYTFVYIHD